MRLSRISSVLLVLPLICASQLLTSLKAKENAPVWNPNFTECSAFSRGNYVLTESNVSRIGFVMTNSTLSVECRYSTFYFEKSFLGIENDNSLCYNHTQINKTHSSIFAKSEHKLTKEQKQQLQAFNGTIQGTNNRMIVHFDKGRLATKWFGLGEFLASRIKDHLKLRFVIATGNATENRTENAMAVLEDYEDKRFIVERVAGPVNCSSCEVKDLKVVKCKGNIQIKNLFV